MSSGRSCSWTSATQLHKMTGRITDARCDSQRRSARVRIRRRIARVGAQEMFNWAGDPVPGDPLLSRRVGELGAGRGQTSAARARTGGVDRGLRKDPALRVYPPLATDGTNPAFDGPVRMRHEVFRCDLEQATPRAARCYFGFGGGAPPSGFHGSVGSGFGGGFGHGWSTIAALTTAARSGMPSITHSPSPEGRRCERYKRGDRLS
jgi:hypothetical protein